MIQFDYVSDLHLNWWAKFNNNFADWEFETKLIAKKLLLKKKGDVLIIAGDFGEWNCQNLWFLEEISLSYDHVFCCLGNHDFYIHNNRNKMIYKDSIERVADFIEKANAIPNVTVLDKSIVEHKGLTIAGSTMWYYPQTPEDAAFHLQCMPDSHCLLVEGKEFVDASFELYKADLDWFKTLEDKNIDIFISHVPPIHIASSGYTPNTNFYTQVDFMPCAHWFCGHTHTIAEQEVPGTDTMLHINPAGYTCENYDDVKEIEIKTISI